MMLIGVTGAGHSLPLPLAGQPFDPSLAESRRCLGTAAPRDRPVVRDHQRDETNDRKGNPAAEVSDGDDYRDGEENDARDGEVALAGTECGGFGAMARQASFVDRTGVRHLASI